MLANDDDRGRLPLDLDPELVRSFRKSKHRVALVKLIRERRVIYKAQAARDLKIDLRTLRGLLAGDGTRYRATLSLGNLGLVREFQGPNGDLLEVTPFCDTFDWTGEGILWI